MIEKFRSVKKITDRSNFSQKEIECEAHLKQYAARNKDGRYIVASPFKIPFMKLGEPKL